MGAVGFGIAGWSYDDWRGIVYPRGCKDTLRYCAGFVDYVEINSSFYGFPVARNCESWVRRVADLGTRFTAKLPQEFTHQFTGLFSLRASRQGSRDSSVAAKVREGFAPLAESGRLTTLLAQFSYRFEHTAQNLDQLRWLRDEFCRVAPLTVEVRHRTWGTPAGLDALRKLGVAVANLDYPGASSGFGVRVTGIDGPRSVAYFRIHGRNADAWFDKDAGRDAVYDYEYDSAEVSELATRTAEIARQANEVVVIANNHFQGQAMKLVVELLAEYRNGCVGVPVPLVERYPQLRAISDEPRQGSLF